ncbi:hypothetical protein DKL51_10460, partial [Micromonospora globispora]
MPSDAATSRPDYLASAWAAACSDGGDRQEVTGVVVPVGLAGGDAGSVDAEPVGAGLLGPGVPPDGVGPGVDGAGGGVPDGLGVAV